MNKLEQLKKMTTVVADTGDIEAIAQYQPQDATTNPSLLLKAANLPQYQHLIDDAVAFAKAQGSDVIRHALEKLSVNFGVEILKNIPGRVSTEVDARLSFDTEATVETAKRIMALYADAGIGADRVLIKIASTYEGIEACRQLEAEGIHCNMTLMFDFAQAVACADAKATLISPFVGRIYDWYKKAEGHDFESAKDPGVLSVAKIYNYFRHFNVHTVVMGASFRNLGQIEHLSGCDFLTISPNLLAELEADNGDLKQHLSLDNAKSIAMDEVHFTESTFRYAMNENPMATEKLAEGIRLFCRDIEKLEAQLGDLI